MLQAFKGLFIDKRNQLDEIVLGGHFALGIMAYTSIVQLLHHIPLDIQGLGIGFGSVIAAMGGGQRFRDGPDIAINATVPSQPGATGDVPLTR